MIVLLYCIVKLIVFNTVLSMYEINDIYTIKIYYVLLYVLLIFRDYVEICNSSVDGFTQHVSYFCCTID